MVGRRASCSVQVGIVIFNWRFRITTPTCTDYSPVYFVFAFCQKLDVTLKGSQVTNIMTYIANQCCRLPRFASLTDYRQILRL